MADRNLIAFYSHPDYHAVDSPALHCSLTEARAAASALAGNGIVVQGVYALSRTGDLAPEGLLKNWGVDDVEQLCLVVVTADGRQIKPRMLREALEQQVSVAVEGEGESAGVSASEGTGESTGESTGEGHQGDGTSEGTSTNDNESESVSIPTLSKTAKTKDKDKDKGKP